jgi:hypothetical protein
MRLSIRWIKKIVQGSREAYHRAVARVRKASQPPGSDLKSPKEFIADVRAKYRREFSEFAELLSTIETAIQIRRPLTSELQLTMDMLMTQCYKSLASVYQLTVRGQIEDAATIVRRVWELGVQAAYIGAETDDAERVQRARRFLAHLWDKFDSDLKSTIPVEVRARWDALVGGYGSVPLARRKRWGPSFYDMLRSLGRADAYGDYEFLSNIAHGSPPFLVPGESF